MARAIDHSVLDEALAGLGDAGHWYLGFSGGVDSTVLLYLLQRWRQAHPGAPALTAIQINHRLQPQADEWERHCAAVCRSLALPLRVEQVAVVPGDRGVEAAAREARYAAFAAQLETGDVLFLGHHLDDQVETFFLRLLRGSGVRGLSAMPAQRALGRGTLVRPLLGVSREQLEAWAAQQDLQYIEDPSNTDGRLDRNYLRHTVLPLLQQRWPGYRRTVSRASEHLARAADLLEAEIEMPATCFSPVGDPGFRAAALAGKPADAAALALRAWLRGGGYPAPDSGALDEFLRQLRESAGGAQPRLQTGDYFLQRYLGTIYLALPADSAPRDSLSLQPDERCSVPGVGEIALAPDSAEGLWLTPGEPLAVRWRSGGERCRPLDRENSTSLKKLLQERGIPPWWRDRVPLFYLGEELLAVGDLWLCASSRSRASGRAGERCYVPRWRPAIPEGFD